PNVKKLMFSQCIRVAADGSKSVNHAGLELIRAEFPMANANGTGLTDEHKRLLTSATFAGANGVQTVPVNPEVPPATNKEEEVRKKIALSAGFNPLEQAINHLRANETGFASIPYARQVPIASHFLRTGELNLAICRLTPARVRSPAIA